MAFDVIAYSAAKKYTDDSMQGVGAVAGKPCQIQSITDITGGHRVTFLWVDNSDVSHTSTMDVMDGQDGADGKGIASVAVNEQSHLIITYTDGTTTDAGAIEVHSAVDSVNGKTGEVTLDAEDVGALPDDTALFSGDYDDLTNKPTLGTAAALNVAASGNASSSEVVKGDDTRLTDSRTPVSHTHTASQITDLSIPTKVSDLTNDSGFITKAVNDLTNYYLKSETYTQAEVDALIGAVSSLDIEVVQSLPTTNISTTTIYLVPKATAGTQNVYDEYICLDTTTTPATWEKIGDTEIDLTNYVQKSSTAGLLKNDGTVDQTDYQPKTLATSIVVNGETKTTVEGALQTFRENVLIHKKWNASTVNDIYWTVDLTTPNNNCRGTLMFTDRGGNVYSVAIMDNSNPVVTKVTRGIAVVGIEEIRCTAKSTSGVTLEVKSKTWDKCMVEFTGYASNGASSTLTATTQAFSTAFDAADVLKLYDITDQPIRAATSATQNGVKYINVSLESSSADSFFGDLYLQDRVGNLYIIALNGTKDNASVVTATKLNGNRNSVLDKQITGIKVGSISTTALSLELKLAAWSTVNAWFVPNVGFDNSRCTLTITDREASAQYDAATELAINTLATNADIPDITGKADKVSSPTSGNLASLDANGNLQDSGVAATGIQAAVDNLLNGDMRPVTSNAAFQGVFYAEKVAGVRTAMTALTNENLNNIRDEGYYYANGTDNVTNKPASTGSESVHNWILQVVRHGTTNRCIQKMFCFNTSKSYYRIYKETSGETFTWSAWTEGTIL